MTNKNLVSWKEEREWTVINLFVKLLHISSALLYSDQFLPGSLLHLHSFPYLWKEDTASTSYRKASRSSWNLSYCEEQIQDK